MSHLLKHRASLDHYKKLILPEWEFIKNRGRVAQYKHRGMQCFDVYRYVRPQISEFMEHLCPLTFEVYNGNRELVEVLLEHVESLNDKDLLQDVLNEALMISLRGQNTDIMHFLLEKGIKTNVRCPVDSLLETIIQERNLSEESMVATAKIMIQYDALDILRGPVKVQKVQLVQYLLSAGAPVQPDFLGLVIHKDDYNDEYQVPQILLEHGADPNVRDRDGYTSLRWAIKRRAKNTVKLLLLHGAQTNVMVGPHFDLTWKLLLHLACEMNDPTIVALLIQAFAGVNRTATLSTAVSSMLRLSKIVRWDVHKGKITPLELVCFSDKPNQEGIADLLLEAGARVRPFFLKLDISSFPLPGVFVRLRELFSQPPSLLLLCRVLIRQCLEGKKLQTIQEHLPLPGPRKDTVLLSNIIQPYVCYLQNFH